VRRDQASWMMIDVGNSAFATTILAALFPVYLPSLFPPDGVSLSILSWTWQTSAISLWGYTVSFSLVITLLLASFLGSWADERGYRKVLLGTFTTIGAIATAGLAYFDSWQSALLCFVIANIGFSASNIFYNSLLSAVGEPREWDTLSLKGYAWGYIGGGALLALNLLLILKYDFFGLSSKKSAIELSFLSVGIWWMVFTIPALLFIHETRRAQSVDGTSGVRHHLKQLWRTIQAVLQTRNLLIFMVSFALYNDGIQTVISMASIYGKEVLQIAEGSLIGTLLMIQVLGLPFTLIMTKVANRFGAKRTLLYSLSFWLLIIVYSYFMKTAVDFWILGILVSFVLGVSQAIPSSIFAKLIPKTRQAEYFAFFALSGKMTSIVGPTLFAVVKDVSGDARLSILALGILFAAGMIGLFFVRVPE